MEDKKKPLVLKSWGEVNEAMKEIASANIQHTAVKAEMDAETLEVQKKYTAQLDKHTTEMTEKSAAVLVFCTAYKSEFNASKSKTLILNYGEIQLKTNPPSLRLRGVDANTAKPVIAELTRKVISKIKAKFKSKAKNYLRITEDMDKNSLKKLPANDLKALGLVIEQAESFIITPNESKVAELIKAA